MFAMPFHPFEKTRQRRSMCVETLGNNDTSEKPRSYERSSLSWHSEKAGMPCGCNAMIGAEYCLTNLVFTRR